MSGNGKERVGVGETEASVYLPTYSRNEPTVLDPAQPSDTTDVTGTPPGVSGHGRGRSSTPGTGTWTRRVVGTLLPRRRSGRRFSISPPRSLCTLSSARVPRWLLPPVCHGRHLPGSPPGRRGAGRSRGTTRGRRDPVPVGVG